MFLELSGAQLTIFIETLESVSISKPFDTMIVFLKKNVYKKLADNNKNMTNYPAYKDLMGFNRFGRKSSHKHLSCV